MEINEHSIGDKCIVFPVHLLTAGQDRMAAIDFSEEDIFLPPENFEIDKYDVVRAANILNKVYFSNADLAQILSNLFSQLKTGGMLIVCKTDDTGRNHASLFVKEEYRFALLKNLNEGSEVENIVLQFSRKK